MAGQRVGIGCLPRHGYGASSEGVIVFITWGSAQKAGPRSVLMGLGFSVFPDFRLPLRLAIIPLKTWGLSVPRIFGLSVWAAIGWIRIPDRCSRVAVGREQR
jgi:hypothetical protein